MLKSTGMHRNIPALLTMRVKRRNLVKIADKAYFTYLPHLALPLAASYTVIPLEQELRNMTVDKTITVKKSGFFIKERFGE